MGNLPCGNMSVRGRRREKVEYEPIPIIGVENVEAKDIPVRVKTKPTEGGLERSNVEYPIISNTTVREIDHTVIVERLADKYVKPPVYTVNAPPPISYEDEAISEATQSAVIDVIANVYEPIDETIDGLPKIFGRRLKDPISVK